MRLASSTRKGICPPKIHSLLDPIENVVELFDRMVDLNPRPSIFAFNFLLTATARMKQYPAIISLFGKMNRDGGGDIVPDACTYGILIHSCCRLNRTDLGFGAFASLMKRGFHPDTIIFNTLINGLCYEKRVEEAVEVFDRMPLMDCKLDVITYNSIIDAHCKEGSMDKALGLLQDMLFKEILPDCYTFNILIHGFSESQRLDEALNMFKRMQQEGMDFAKLEEWTMLKLS